MARKKLTEAQKQFISGDDENNQSSQQVNTQVDTQANTQISDDIGSKLKKELFGEREMKESSVRFTVDIPASLHKRLNQLSVDTGKPKTELVRTILKQALNSLDY